MAQDSIREYKMVVIGGSAGSVETILKIAAVLQRPVDTCFIVVLHRKNRPDSVLAELIAAKTNLMVKEVEDKDPLIPGTIYIAPADYHLLIEDRTTLSLDYSEKVHFCRPSIDVTFESVAEVFGASALGVLLSGANADGAEGLYKIKKAGGTTIVLNPTSAEVDYMPQQAIKLFEPDAVVMADLLPVFIKTILHA